MILGRSRAAAWKSSPGTVPGDDSQAEKEPGSLVQKQGVTLGTTGIFGSQQLWGPLWPLSSLGKSSLKFHSK